MRTFTLPLVVLALAACGQQSDTTATTSSEDAMPSTETVSSDDMANPATPASGETPAEAETAAVTEKQ